MKVLLIGGTGFIGTRVAEELVLQRGDQVRAMVRDYVKAVRLARLPVEWVDLTTLDVETAREAASGCDAVICAAHPFGSPREGQVALDICRAAAAAAGRTSTRRLVFLSSAAVYGSDGRIPAPTTAYGRIKWRCEQYLAHENTVEAVILRPGIVYGPFSRSWTSLPARQMASGNLVLPAQSRGACNAIYIDDVARAAVEALGIDAPQPVVLDLNVGERVTWRSFYRAYEAAIRPGSVVEWPMDALTAMLQARHKDNTNWRAFKRLVGDRIVRERLNAVPALAAMNRAGKSLGWSGLPPAASPNGQPAHATTSTTAAHLPTPLLLDLYMRAPYLDGSKAASVLGFQPRGLADGMATTVEWLRWAGLAPARSKGPADPWSDLPLDARRFEAELRCFPESHVR